VGALLRQQERDAAPDAAPPPVTMATFPATMPLAILIS